MNIYFRLYISIILLFDTLIYLLFLHFITGLKKCIFFFSSSLICLWLTFHIIFYDIAVSASNTDG